MLRKYYLINAILISVVILLGYKLYADIQKPIDNLPSANKTESAIPLAVKEIKPEAISTYNNYKIIEEKDLFRPEREMTKNQENVINDSPPPELVGIIINKSGGKAFFMDPVLKTTKVYKKNNTVSGYMIQDILENKVVLTRGGEKSELKISHVKTIEEPGKSAPKQLKYRGIQSRAISRDRKKQAAKQPPINIKMPLPAYIPPRNLAPIPLATTPETKER
ncbi:MAG: hypothetical protein KKC46_08695 [Proteobacteria bacterium]|nr:hypothetical protein [Pseudomonadota bacterium]